MKIDWAIKFGELSSDKEFVGKCENLTENLKSLQSALDQCLTHKKAEYDKMSNPCKIELDLFIAFTLNALQWVSLKIQGIDPTKHPIKNEMDRIKKTMLRWKEVKDRDKRPKVNKDAAKRFIKSGLYDPRALGAPKNKKIKFDQ